MHFRTIYYRLPVSWRYFIRRLYYLPIDITDSLTKRRPPMVPPKGRIFTGGGDFVETGDRFVGYFTKYARLIASSRVLDIGSGMGRMAIPLTKVITSGAYEGIDIVKEAVDYCQNEIHSRFSHFNFTHLQLENDLYTTSGEKANQIRLPFENTSFDLVILISVFTHMSVDEIAHYLKEIARMLDNNGRCFATFFTYEDQPKSNKKNFNFKHIYDDYALMDQRVKSANIALKYSRLLELIDQAGLEVEMYDKGSWQSGDEALDFQDVLVIKKSEVSV